MENNLQYKEYQECDYERVKELLSKDEENSRDLQFILKLYPKTLRLAYLEEKVVAIFQLVLGRNTSNIIVYVSPEYRCRGFGEAILKYGEGLINDVHPKEIITQYLCTNENSKHFARKFGYERYYSCSFMKRSDGRFMADEIPARQYCADDYDEAFALYAKAFHEMRLRTGDFPNSVVQQPSEPCRKAWNDDYKNRYTYIYNGEIVGHAHIEENEVSSISVRTDLHGQGIGRSFLKYLCNLIYDKGYNEVILWCVVGNKARFLYDSMGFKEVYTSEYGHKELQ